MGQGSQRNKLCRCNSGKKEKICCGAIDATHFDIPLADNQIHLYREHLRQIKDRIDFASNILSIAPGASIIKLQVESASLQVRIVLELLVLSSFILEESKFEKIKDNFKEGNYKTARKIIEQSNTKYLPEATVQEKASNSSKYDYNLKPKEGALQEDELWQEWARLSKLIHAKNPYKKDFDWDKEIEETQILIEKIIKLMEHHCIHLNNQNYMLIGQISPTGVNLTSFMKKRNE